MARRFPSRGVAIRSPRRATDWIGGANTGQTRTLAVSTALIHKSFDTRIQFSPNSPFTIVRVRGIFVAIPVDLAADTECFGAFGMAIVNGEAFDAGVVAVPSPITESSDERWFVHSYWATLGRAVASPGNVDFIPAKVTIDSKAMRKVETGDVIISVMESGAGLDSARVYWNDRILVKLH